MRVVAIYNPDNEFSRSVNEFTRSLESRSVAKVEPISTETVEGAHMAELYGITDYPAIIVIADNGSMQKFWQGSQLPLVDEVISYLIA